ncbi:MAG: tRNA (cytidine(34)-2'-O)-methyltransferase, partial [Peptococcaceae bacterium]|nr:tRNA (cytidine(34)-2'-O)-methyltransferase [Peptococcaceae bacterium]
VGGTLHLIQPLGFSLEDKQLKRAGLDYWHLLDVHLYENIEEFETLNPVGVRYCATTKAGRTYAEGCYQQGDYFLFGKETKGLPTALLKKYEATSIRLPMREEARSLNLSNAVAVVVYEALRQWRYPGLV